MFATGCATYPGIVDVGPYQVAPGRMARSISPIPQMVQDPGGYAVDTVDSLVGSVFTQPISDPLVVASQVNQLINGVMGPGTGASQGILTGMQYYNVGMGLLRQPSNVLPLVRTFVR